MNQLIYNPNNTKEKKVKTKVWIILLIAVICVLVCLSTVFAIANQNNHTILKNVYIGEAHVGNNTMEEAKEKILTQIDDSEYENQEVSLHIGDKNYVVKAEDVGFSVTNLEQAVEEAYQFGRDKNFIANNYTILWNHFKNKIIPLEYGLNEAKMNDIITKISATNESLVLDDQYVISGDKIVITKGQEGLKIDKEKLKEYITSAMINHVSIVEVPVIQSEAKKIDLNKLYTEVYVAPQDASYISGDGKFEIIPEKTGIDFDMVSAKEQYESASASGEVVIALRTLEPSVKVADIEGEIFKDTIASSSIHYQTTDIVKMAVEKLNGITINPKEEISFVKVVEMTGVSNDYSALASAIYNAALKAGLKITERVPNEKPVNFVEPSLDAMVKAGSADLKIQNERNIPVKIASTAQNDTIEVKILGQKAEKDPILVLESKVIEKEAYTVKEEKDATMYVGSRKVVTLGADGYTSEAYLVTKNENGEELSRALVSKDKYAMTEEVVKVGTKVKVVTTPTPTVPVVTPAPEEEKPPRKIPAGWDSPESPYSRKR